MSSYKAYGLFSSADVPKRLSNIFGAINRLVSDGGDARSQGGLKDGKIIKRFEHISALSKEDRVSMFK